MRSLGAWRRWWRCCLFAGSVVWVLTAGMMPNSWANPSEADQEALDFFERSVRPVLAENCFQCHGPDTQWAGLRLDSREGMLHGGDMGAVLIPEDPDNSRIIQALRYQGEIKMPPDGPLDTETVDAIAHWIRLGAPWPESSNAASHGPLTMEDRIARARETHWSFQPVRFPEPPQVSGDAPVISDVDRFLLEKLEAADLGFSERADARTLLRRIHHDLTGLMPDATAVQAFEAEQSPEAFARVVDDLLDSPHFGERWGRHWLDIARYADTKGYVFQEERRYPYAHTYRDYVIRALNEDLPYDTFIKHQIAADRMELSNDRGPLAALGFLTLGRRFLNNPHDITDDRIDVVTRGFLGLTVSCARCHDHKYDPIGIDDYYSMYGVFRSIEEPQELPLIREPDPEDPQYQDFLAAVAEKDREHDALIAELHVALSRHARERVREYLLAVHELAGNGSDEQLRTYARDRDLRWQFIEGWQRYLQARAEAQDPVFTAWFAFAALPEAEFSAHAPELATQIAAGQLPDNPVNPRVAAAFNEQAPESMAAVAEIYGGLLRDVERDWQARLAAHSQVTIRQGDAAAPYPEALPDANAEAVRQVLYGAQSPANIALESIFDLSDVPTQARIRAVRLAKANIEATHPGRPERAQSVVERNPPFDPHIFRRGNPQLPGDSVPRQNLAILASDQETAYSDSSGRLAFAEQIASKDNPLTARVMVNRVWMYLMGTPLVDTPSDFGVRSEAPRHPELLDYLAYRFMEEGWSVKSLIRIIVNSHAYQQESRDRAEAQEIDPVNTLWWRQERKRMDFEVMRDSLLAAADNLDTSLFGESVDITTPPYPNRRTVYSFIERQNLPGLFRTFDFAGPDTHSPMRYKTTVPQQALYMMNNAFVVEQARKLAARPEQETGSLQNGDAIRQLYHYVFQRDPDTEELSLAQQFLEKQQAVDAPMLSDWAYGYGRVVLSESDADAAEDALPFEVDFTPLPHFAENQWRGGEEIPDSSLAWASLSANGGHPGRTNDQSVIRRWRAPNTGSVTLGGALEHSNENGDGVIGAVISARYGVIWRATVHNGRAESSVDSLAVEAGDVLDFVVLPGPTDSFDSFRWAPEITLHTPDNRLEGWHAARDFSGPPPPPLTPWEQYAQVLLLSNEFVFVD